MADRKRTPDVLAELLGADLAQAEQPSPLTAVSAPAAEKARRKASALQSEMLLVGSAASSVQNDKWEVEIVSFQEHRGWRPRFVNGVEMADWLRGPLLQDYVNERGSEGWELAAGTTKERLFGAADGLQLYFKRRR